MLEAYKNNRNRLPYGHVEILLKKLVYTEPRIIHNFINKAFINNKRESVSVKETTATTQKSAQKSNTNISSHDVLPVVNDTR